MSPVSPPKGDVIAYVRSVLHSGDVCIDGGANTGTVTEAMAQTVGPTGFVYAVEPDSRCQDALDGLAERFGCVRRVSAALVATPGTYALYQGVGSPQSSLIPDAVTDPLGVDTVSGVTLDSLCGRTVALTKLDLQGGEYQALAGASALLRSCTRWVVEVWPSILQQQGVSAEAFHDRFAAHGLTGHWLEDTVRPFLAEEFVTWWRDTHRFVNVVFSR